MELVIKIAENWEWRKELLIYTWTFMILFAPFLFV